MRTLDPRVVSLWRLQGLVRVGTFWLPVSLGLGGTMGFQAGWMAGAALGASLLLFFLVMAVLWPPLAWERFRFDVREDDLLVEHGVLFRRTVSIPRDRIQHVDTRQGPIERVFGLTRVVVYTAAGMSADGSIPGLAEPDADALRDTLARRRGDDGV